MDTLIEWGRTFWVWLRGYLIIIGEWCRELVNATFGWYIGREFTFAEANLLVWGGLAIVLTVVVIARYLFSVNARR